MKLHLANSNGNHIITSYNAGAVGINKQLYTTSIIISPTDLIENWPPQDFESIEAVHLALVLTLKPDVVLLGTGAKHQFIHPKLCSLITEAGLSIECMTTGAACRTYNILMNEGRNVAAALLL